MTATEQAADLRERVDVQRKLIETARSNGGVSADALHEIQQLDSQCRRMWHDLEIDIEEYHRHNKGVPDEIRDPYTLHDMQKAQRVLEQASGAAMAAMATAAPPYVRTSAGRELVISNLSWATDGSCTFELIDALDPAREGVFDVVEVGGIVTTVLLQNEVLGPPAKVRAVPKHKRGVLVP